MVWPETRKPIVERMATHDDPNSSGEKTVREKMWVTRREGTNLSQSQKKPGEFSPLTRDESSQLGHVTLSHISDGDDEPSYGSMPVVMYIDDEHSGRSREQEVAELIAVLIPLVAKGVAIGVPHAQRIWNEKARPVIRSRMEQVDERRARRRQRRADRQPVVAEASGEVVDRSLELTTASEEFRLNMSSSEARARYLAALLARQFSDDQLRMLTDADVDEDEGFAALERAFSQLPSAEVAKMLENVDELPLLLTGDTLAAITMILGEEHVDDVRIALNERQEP